MHVCDCIEYPGQKALSWAAWDVGTLHWSKIKAYLINVTIKETEAKLLPENVKKSQESNNTISHLTAHISVLGHFINQKSQV